MNQNKAIRHIQRAAQILSFGVVNVGKHILDSLDPYGSGKECDISLLVKRILNSFSYNSKQNLLCVVKQCLDVLQSPSYEDMPKHTEEFYITAVPFTRIESLTAASLTSNEIDNVFTDVRSLLWEAYMFSEDIKRMLDDTSQQRIMVQSINRMASDINTTFMQALADWGVEYNVTKMRFEGLDIGERKPIGLTADDEQERTSSIKKHTGEPKIAKVHSAHKIRQHSIATIQAFKNGGGNDLRVLVEHILELPNYNSRMRLLDRIRDCLHVLRASTVNQSREGVTQLPGSPKEFYDKRVHKMSDKDIEPIEIVFKLQEQAGMFAAELRKEFANPEFQKHVKIINDIANDLTETFETELDDREIKHVRGKGFRGVGIGTPCAVGDERPVKRKRKYR